jgi:hypothetical protein
MYLRRVARFCAWTIASGCFLIIALYGILVAINWSDEAPSADAVRLQRIVSERAPIADRDNAFVLSLGCLLRGQGCLSVGTGAQSVHGALRVAGVRRLRADARQGGRLHGVEVGSHQGVGRGLQTR